MPHVDDCKEISQSLGFGASRKDKCPGNAYSQDCLHKLTDLLPSYLVTTPHFYDNSNLVEHLLFIVGFAEYRRQDVQLMVIVLGCLDQQSHSAPYYGKCVSALRARLSALS
jgi:hypothetical protein